jgi:hypothetical protein
MAKRLAGCIDLVDLSTIRNTVDVHLNRVAHMADDGTQGRVISSAGSAPATAHHAPAGAKPQQGPAG